MFRCTNFQHQRKVSALYKFTNFCAIRWDHLNHLIRVLLEVGWSLLKRVTSLISSPIYSINREYHSIRPNNQSPPLSSPLKEEAQVLLVVTWLHSFQSLLKRKIHQINTQAPHILRRRLSRWVLKEYRRPRNLLMEQVLPSSVRMKDSELEHIHGPPLQISPKLF